MCDTGSTIPFSWERVATVQTAQRSAVARHYDKDGLQTLIRGVYHVIAQVTVISQISTQPVIHLVIGGNVIGEYVGNVGYDEGTSVCCKEANCSLSTLNINYINYIQKYTKISVTLDHWNDPFSLCKTQLVDGNHHRSFLQAALLEDKSSK